MAITGETYGTVDASVVNGGIATLALSGGGTTPEGSTTTTAVLYWKYDPNSSSGITGQSWYAGEEFSFPQSLAQNITEDADMNSYIAELIESVGEEDARNQLNSAFSTWPSKNEFISTHGNYWTLWKQTGCFDLLF